MSMSGVGWNFGKYCVVREQKCFGYGKFLKAVFGPVAQLWLHSLSMWSLKFFLRLFFFLSWFGKGRCLKSWGKKTVAQTGPVLKSSFWLCTTVTYFFPHVWASSNSCHHHLSKGFRGLMLWWVFVFVCFSHQSK